MEQEILNLIEDIDSDKKERFKNINLNPTENISNLDGQERLKVGYVGDRYKQTEDEIQEDKEFYKKAYPTDN